LYALWHQVFSLQTFHILGLLPCSGTIPLSY
jgi:hypothetical protein